MDGFFPLENKITVSISREKFCLNLLLQELCLHTKLLAPANTPIADFLARAIEPPSFVVTRNAVQLLKVSNVSVVI
jgi:hypothetical protein